jgi:hypothetical protein
MFAGQLAFNILTESGMARGVEGLIRGQLEEVLGKGIPSPGVAAVQAPVFHSHALSLFLQLKETPSRDQLAATLEAGEMR